MTFEETGKYSKAWWIKLVKEHGADGGMAYLRTQAHIPGQEYNKCKEAIDSLVNTAYIQMLKGQQVEGHTTGNSVRYKVTSFGHRYLDEHQDELVEAEPKDELPRTASRPVVLPASTNHAVPVMPQLTRRIPKAGVWKDADGLTRTDHFPIDPEERPAPSRLDKDELWRKAQKVAASFEDYAPATEDAEELLTPKLLLPVPQFIDQLRRLLHEVAFDKYGDQITAKDILAAAEEKDHE